MGAHEPLRVTYLGATCLCIETAEREQFQRKPTSHPHCLFELATIRGLLAFELDSTDTLSVVCSRTRLATDIENPTLANKRAEAMQKPCKDLEYIGFETLDPSGENLVCPGRCRLMKSAARYRQHGRHKAYRLVEHQRTAAQGRSSIMSRRQQRHVLLLPPCWMELVGACEQE